MIRSDKHQIQTQTVTERLDSMDRKIVNNPLSNNRGDDDLRLYFDPLLREAGGKVPDIGADILTRLHNLGLLDVLGARVWSSIHGSNWKVRQAAANAVLNYIGMPLNARYIGKSKKLFLALIE